MITQDAIFFTGEGDAWFTRNRGALGTIEAVRNDPVLRLLWRSKAQPRSVLEVGCANGWRLEALHHEYGAVCCGVDASALAIADGLARYSSLDLRQGIARNLPFTLPFDLVICYFVLHWVDRRTLLRSLAEMDRLVTDGGHLIIGDFYPTVPSSVPYHHREGIYTYSALYVNALLDLGLYEIMDSMVFDHALRSRRPIAAESRAGCWLLKRSE